MSFDFVLQPIGCDGYLGSPKREDNCRQCGGSNENCNTIRGLFNETELQVGYNDILLIPAGATNILVREEGKGSNNYLGTNSILNANFKVLKYFKSQLISQ